MPQPTVSRGILELENQLGVQLFSRNKRNVYLTREGETFLHYALDIVDMAERAQFAVEQIHSGMDGQISISTLPTTNEVLTLCLSTFSQRYPNIFVDITQVKGSEQARYLRQLRADFFFAQEAMLPDDTSQLDYLPTHRDTLVLVVPKGDPLTKEPLDFKKLHRERFIMQAKNNSPLLHDQINLLCEKHRFTPRIVQRYDMAEPVLLSVAAGLGISILPFGLAHSLAPDSVDTIPIEDEELQTVYICAWPREQSNPTAKLFQEVVKELFPTQAQN